MRIRLKIKLNIIKFLNSNYKMFFWLFFSKKNNTPLISIDTNCYFFVIFDIIPCFFHAFTPVNIIKYKNRIIMNSVQTLFKVINRCFFLMIAIKIDQVVFFIKEILWQSRFKISNFNLYIIEIKFLKLIL